MQRREFLQSAIVGGGAMVTVGPGAHAADASPSASIPGQYGSFEEWLLAARAANMAFLGAPHGREPERFLRYLLLWAEAMPKPAPADQAWQALAGARERVEFAMVAPGRPFVVSMFRMAPGCLLPAHCHPGGGGITLCLEGSVDIQHFNLAEGAPPFSETGSAATVRLDSLTHLSADRYTLFTPQRSNLHQLRAGPNGAVGVDLAAQWQGGGEFSFLRFENKRARDTSNVGATLKGKWSGMSIAEAYV
jgi:hypothetical protein